jgi:hypothetical protein
MSCLRSQVRTPLKRHAKCLRSLKRNVWYSWKLSTTGRLSHTCLVYVFRAIVGRFHPATRRLKEIVDSGELGTLTKIEANVLLTSGFIKDDDIRMVYDLGGGGMMDMGCESYSTILLRISRLYSPQATLCLCRGTYQVPIQQRSSVPSQTYIRSSLRSIWPPLLRSLFPPREGLQELGLPTG